MGVTKQPGSRTALERQAIEGDSPVGEIGVASRRVPE